MKLNITAASRAAQVSRTTVYNAMQDGRLSVEKGPSGNTLIDSSELERVFGRVDVLRAQRERQPERSAWELDVELFRRENALLRDQIRMQNAQIEMLRSQLAAASDREKRVFSLVERLLPERVKTMRQKPERQPQQNEGVRVTKLYGR